MRMGDLGMKPVVQAGSLTANLHCNDATLV